MTIPEHILVPLSTVSLALLSVVIRSLVKFSLIETGTDLTFSATTLQLSLFIYDIEVVMVDPNKWSKTIVDVIIFFILLALWGITLKCVQKHMKLDEIYEKSYSYYDILTIVLGVGSLLFEIWWRL